MQNRDYDKFLKRAKESIDSFALPELFRYIDDEDLYTTSQIAAVLGKSRETVARWCREGKLETIGSGHYRVSGIDLKRFLFAVYRKRISNLLDR